MAGHEVLDEARLRELAEAATPGPWETYENAAGNIGIGEVEGRKVAMFQTSTADRKGWAYRHHLRNAAFIAAANPATILALLDALSAERERGEYRIAEAYQVIGAIANAGGLFEHPDVQRALTYFSEAKPEGEILPFSLADQKAGGEKK